MKSRPLAWTRLSRIAPLAMGLLALWPAACRKKPQVGLEVDVPSSLNVTWVEVGVFGGVSCSTLSPMLPGGIPVEGATAKLAFQVDKSSPALGDLPKTKYAFAAVGKDANCGVVAAGCTDADVNVETSVAISLQQVNGGAAPCPAGARCLEARCIPGSDNGDPALGADCSLELVGAGPLNDPLAGAGELVSAPAVVPTANGFLIGYREWSANGAAAISFIEVDNGGGATAGPQTSLVDRCGSGQEFDAMGLALSAPTAGLAVLSRANCGTDKPAGFDLFQIDATGNPLQSGFEGAGNSQRTLSTGHALAYDPTSTDFFLTFVDSGNANLVFAQGNHFEQKPAVSFGGSGTKTGAWVATSDKVRAFVAAGTGGAPPPPPPPPPTDSGTDDGGEGGVDANPPPPPADAGSGSTLRLQVLNSTDDPATLATAPLTDTFNGTWASVVATGARVIVASDGSSAGRQVAYRIYEGGVQKTSDALVVDGAGAVPYADMAINQDRLFFFVEKVGAPTNPSSLTLFAFTQATTTPALKRRVILNSDTRIPTMTSVRDGRIAVAASDTRVAVAWTAGKTLTDKDAVGGYALFACSAQ